MEMIFEVQGSEPEPYEIVVRKAEGVVLIACNCRAGRVEQLCKHRRAILAGDGSAVGRSSHPVADVVALAIGTPVVAALGRLVDLEAEEVRIKREIARAKKELAVAMRG